MTSTEKSQKRRSRCTKIRKHEEVKRRDRECKKIVNAAAAIARECNKEMVKNYCLKERERK